LKDTAVRIATILVVCTLNMGAQADMSIDMVRVTCIPELYYHTRENKEYTLLAEAIAHGFESFDDAARQKRLTLLESYGLYTPASKNQACSAPLREHKTTASAQQANHLPIDFVRITCIPQLRYLEIEALSDPHLREAITRRVSAGASSEATYKQMERSGLFVPEKLNYVCKMPESTYELRVTQKPPTQSSMCGVSSRVSFSLSANRKEWFRDVLLNENCTDAPSVASVTISDGKQGWTGRREMIICLKDRPGDQVRCPFYGLPLSSIGVIPENIKGPARAMLEKQLDEMETAYVITQSNLLKQPKN